MRKPFFFGVVLGVLALPVAAGAAGDKKDIDLSSGPASVEDLQLGAGGLEPPEVTRKRDESIQMLTELIRGLSDGEVKAVRMVQLAELYWEKAQQLHLSAVARYNKAYDQWYEKTDGGKKRGIKEPQLSQFDTQSDDVTKKAIQIYEYVLKKYPKSNKSDAALFYLGLNYLDLKQVAKAMAVFNDLERYHKNSKHIPDAHLALAEFHFDNKQIDEALAEYKKAAQAAKERNAENYGYAVYKMGWCFLNSGNPNDANKAVGAFKEVIRWSADRQEQGLALKDQALRDLVAAYAELGSINIDEVEAYFRSVGGGDYFRAMLTLLAGTYFEQGRDDESIAIYRRLIKLEPMSVDVLSWETEIMKAYIRKGDRNIVLKQMNRIVQMLDPNSRWVKQNANEQDKIDSYRESTELAISKYTFEVYEESRRLHKRYSGKESWEGFLLAEQYCRYYLQTFPKSRNSYEMTMMLAETRWKIANHAFAKKQGAEFQIGKFDDAGQTYLKVMELQGPKGKHFQNAGDGLLLAYDKMVEIAKPPKPKEGDFTPMQLPAVQRKLIAATDKYVEMNPGGKRIVPSKYKSAYTYYEYNQFNDAVPRFERIIKEHPESKQARFAADLILNVFEVKKDTASVNKYAKAFLGVPPLVADAKFKADLENIVERSSFNMIQPLMADKSNAEKNEQAAKAYLKFAAEYKSSDLKDKALYNASLALINAGRVTDAIQVRERLIREHPTSDLTPNVVLFLGDNYRKITYFEKAVGYYELLASKYANSFKTKDGKIDPRPANDALYNAALFRENLGQWEEAIGNYRKYLKRVGKSGDAHEVLFTIAEIYEEHGHTKSAAKTYEEYLSTYGKTHPDYYLDAKIKLADMDYRKGSRSSAYKQYAQIARDYQGLVKAKKKIGPTGLAAAAKSAFMTLEPEWENYQKMRVDLPSGVRAPYSAGEIKKINDHQAKQIKEKLAAVKALTDKYKAVVAYKHGEWAVASLYQMAEIQRDLHETFVKAPLPPYLDEAQAAIYKLELEDRYINPAKQGATEVYKKALDTSHSYGIYNDYARKTLVQLERISPEQYRRDPEIRIAAGSSNEALYSSPLLDLK